jgi:hypothetical protein
MCLGKSVLASARLLIIAMSMPFGRLAPTLTYYFILQASSIRHDPLHETFHGVEGHPNFMGLENDAFEAFALEAAKP